MNALQWMQPRDPHSAGRVVSILTAVAVGVTAVSAPLQPAGPRWGAAQLIVTAAIVALGVVLSALVHRFDEAHRWAWALCPLLAVAAITVRRPADERRIGRPRRSSSCSPRCTAPPGCARPARLS